MLTATGITALADLITVCFGLVWIADVQHVAGLAPRLWDVHVVCRKPWLERLLGWQGV
jgi:hypothetical protein